MARELGYILTPRQKKLTVLVSVMSVIGALLETLGVSVIYPVVEAMVTPEMLFDNRFAGPVLKAMNIHTQGQIILLMCIFVVFVYVFKNAYLLFFIWVKAKYTGKITREISVSQMDSYMDRDYTFFLNTSVGTLIRGTNENPNGIRNLITNFFQLITDGMTAVFIGIYLLYTDWILALCVIAVGMVCLLLTVFVFKKWSRRAAQKNWKYNRLSNKYMMEAFNGIKEIIVMRRQKFFTKRYDYAVKKQREAGVESTVVGSIPKYFIEAASLSSIIIAVGLRIQHMADPAAYLVVLSSFALGVFRIMPSLGRISNSFTQLTYYRPHLNDVYKNIIASRETDERRKKEAEEAAKNNEYAKELSVEDQKKIQFKKDIRIDNISWHYPDTEEYVLDGLDIDIKIGQSVGIIGSSGAGKSTLMDIILGLYHPQKGQILMDGTDIRVIPEAWSRIIGYVPQSVYLTDDSIRANVAFGQEIKVSEEFDKKIWSALDEAQIGDFIRGLKDGLDTQVGDKGIRLSGGQRQRIAIARALYFNPQVIVFDEATSALDNETEADLMKAIDALHGRKTMIIVAHRLTTIKNCDVIYRIENGTASPVEKSELGV